MFFKKYYCVFILYCQNFVDIDPALITIKFFIYVMKIEINNIVLPINYRKSAADLAKDAICRVCARVACTPLSEKIEGYDIMSAICSITNVAVSSITLATFSFEFSIVLNFDLSCAKCFVFKRKNVIILRVRLAKARCT